MNAPRNNPAARGGMTLVELMVAIAIIAILAAVLLGAAATAGGTAREAKTKSMVTRLHTLLMERYDLYRTRRVELNTRDVVGGSPGNGVPDWLDNATVARTGIDFGSLDTRVHTAAGRLVATRELMKLELPDRWTDVTLAPIDLAGTTNDPLFLSQSPQLRQLYLRVYNQARVRSGQTVEKLLSNEAAECLYLVIVYATGDGEARGLFKETDTGDTDGDGLLEFLDGWGNPISWVRWAPGYESDAQISVGSLREDFADASPGQQSAVVVEAVLEDHDPYDLFRVDNPVGPNGGFTLALLDTTNVRGWRLAPLVYSPGADGEVGLALYDQTATAVDPYFDADPGTANAQRRGELDPDDRESAADNVTNHQIATLSRTR